MSALPYLVGPVVGGLIWWVFIRSWQTRRIIKEIVERVERHDRKRDGAD